LTIWVDAGATILSVTNAAAFQAYNAATMSLAAASTSTTGQADPGNAQLSRVDILVTPALVNTAFTVTVAGSAGNADLRWSNAVNIDTAGTLALEINGTDCGDFIVVGDDNKGPGDFDYAPADPMNPTPAEMERGGESDAKAIFIGTHSEPITNGTVLTAIGIRYRTPIMDAMFGQPTISVVKVNGHGGDDVIRVTSEITAQQSTLDGGSGNDNIHGGGGKATINGGNGHDLLIGGAADDIINGGNGDDAIFGGLGADRAYGGDGNDWIAGGGDNDPLLRGGNGDDVISGGDGLDRLLGDGGSNRLYKDTADLLVSGGDFFVTPPDPVAQGLMDLLNKLWDDNDLSDGRDTLDELIAGLFLP
jgi:Ca2+-binding RTX toxin-like protein